MEDSPEAVAARATSEQWEISLSNFETSYLTLGNQLQEDAID